MLERAISLLEGFPFPFSVVYILDYALAKVDGNLYSDFPLAGIRLRRRLS
jgi:hypothetical protein